MLLVGRVQFILGARRMRRMLWHTARTKGHMQILSVSSLIALWTTAIAPRLLATLLLALMAATLLSACGGEDTPPPTATPPPTPVLPVIASPATTARAIGRVGASLFTPRFNHGAILLGSGRVLVSGGFTGTANNNFIAPFPLGLLQVYGPDTGAWSDLEPAAGPGLLYSSVSLADGGVLFVGLTEVESGVASMASIFDPAGDSWAPVPRPHCRSGQPTFGPAGGRPGPGRRRLGL